MSSVIKFLKSVSTKSITKSSATSLKWSDIRRNYGDKPKAGSSSKQVMVQGTEDIRVRVRRARPADIPRVLRFVKDHSRLAWPGLVGKIPETNSHIAISDYVARTLAQGHSMLAEQQEAKRGWSQIRGLALSTSVCPWDATMLEKWARCVRCTRSRKLMLFTAHCLRAPGLHDKYRVHNIMQVVLMVPPNAPKSSEIIQMLAKNSIQRGRDLGFQVLRFDVTDDPVAKVLDSLQLKKEYEFNYEVLPNAIKIFSDDTSNNASDAKEGKNIIVYTAFTHADKS
ncbi:unnamed protein product, partial [Brenthis ino]